MFLKTPVLNRTSHHAGYFLSSFTDKSFDIRIDEFIQKIKVQVLYYMWY